MTGKRPAARSAAKGDETPSFEVLSDEDFAEKSSVAWKAYAADVSARIDAGDPLDKQQRQFAVGALREYAKTMPVRAKRRQGPKPKFPHADEALVYAGLRVAGWSHAKAIAYISDRYDVTDLGIARGISRHRQAAFLVFGVPDPGDK